jgi:hypothetical protein
MRRRLLADVAVVIVALAILAFLILPSVLPAPAPTSVLLMRAGNASYATGGSLDRSSALKHNAVLSGSFVTNVSATVRIQQSGHSIDVTQCRVLNQVCTVVPFVKVTNRV